MSKKLCLAMQYPEGYLEAQQAKSSEGEEEEEEEKTVKKRGKKRRISGEGVCSMIQSSSTTGIYHRC